MNGYYIDYTVSRATYLKENNSSTCILFSRYKHAKSAIAMAKISQIMDTDDRFGGFITDEEWNNDEMKYTILRLNNNIVTDENDSVFRFLAFHTSEQRDLFLKENINLVKDYFML